MSHFSKLFSVCVYVAFLVGCATRSPIPIPELKESIDLKIGIAADTQITTPDRTSGYLFRNMAVDSLINVAVRTSAQEYLASEHLNYMLKSLANESPDLILYLGDAANSGCKDEIRAFLEVMISFRAESQIPVFLVVGNHDYLATGNQADSDAREQACAGKNYYTKDDLVRLFSKYNSDSAIIENKNGHYQIGSFVDVFNDPASEMSKMCVNLHEHMQHTRSCFYSGIVWLEAEGKPSIPLLLTDTSDYADVKLLPKVSEYLSFFGLRGSISWNSGQTKWFERHLEEGGKFRVIASHYPVTDLGWWWKYMGRPGDLMSADGTNLWLSAHSHTSTLNEEGQAINYGTPEEGFKIAHHFNVGSTTDYKPHVALANIKPGKIKLNTLFSLKGDDLRECKSNLYLHYDASARETERQLGLTKAYRTLGYDTQASRKRIDELLDAKGSDAREYWVRCLINIAAENEDKISFQPLLKVDRSPKSR